jgi:hypothetical protein
VITAAQATPEQESGCCLHLRYEGKTMASKVGRLAQANALIRAVSEHGRRFFFHAASGRVASLELDRVGRVWFVDDYTGKRIYTHRTHIPSRWMGFSHGGTLRSLVEALRDYIVAGQQIDAWRIATPRLNEEDGDIWGYGPEASAALRQQVLSLPIFKTPA